MKTIAGLQFTIPTTLRKTARMHIARDRKTLCGTPFARAFPGEPPGRMWSQLCERCENIRRTEMKAEQEAACPTSK